MKLPLQSMPLLGRRAGVVLFAALLAGCTVYPDGTVVYADGTVVYPPGVATPVGRSTFDRAFEAASGALSDNGLSLRTVDRSSGVIAGTTGAQTITANVRPQPDGTTRVEFKQSAGGDPNLVNRVVDSYNRRMGR